MVLLLGATTYIGQGFARVLRRRKDAFIPLSRSAFDYTRFEFLLDYVRKSKPDLLINAAGTAELPANDPGEADRMEMLQANTLLPQAIARVCSLTNTPWGHISSGSIYSGAKFLENGNVRIESNLGLPAARSLFSAHPEKFHGFTELDEPNFCFKAAPCTFYSGTKALAEEALRNGQNYIWRLRLPFNEFDGPANFLSHLQDALHIRDGINSLSHLDDCVSACLELWERCAPFGTYNVVNPGILSTHDLLQTIQRILKPSRQLRLYTYEQDADPESEKCQSPDCILDASKMLNVGVKLREVHDAIEKSLTHWQPHTSHVLNSLA